MSPTKVEITGSWPQSLQIKIAIISLYGFLFGVLWFAIWFVCELVSLLT